MGTIFLVDDHPVVRRGIQGLIQQEPELEVVGEASSGAEALSVIPSVQPDLVIIDLSMEGVSGLELIARVKQLMPELLVLVVSIYEDNMHKTRAREAGADGYVGKQQAEELLVEAIHELLLGRPFFA